jgi:hypothetical protein
MEPLKCGGKPSVQYIRSSPPVSKSAVHTSMPPFFSIGQVLKGCKSTYTIVKELHRAVDEAAVYLAR